MAKQKPKMVQCRYAKCSFLHETKELLKDEAVQGGKQNYYYHPDCFHTMQTINEIKDLFYNKIDSTLTGKQIGFLMSTINNIVFNKHVDADYLKFAVEYFVNNKPGALKHPPGLHYIIQDSDVKTAWEKEQNVKIRAELKEAASKQINEVVNESWSLPNVIVQEFKSKRNKFSKVLEV